MSENDVGLSGTYYKDMNYVEWSFPDNLPTDNVEISIAALNGLKLERVGYERGILIIRAGGYRFGMYHDQDCCESVDLIDGLDDLLSIVGTKIVSARKETNSDLPVPDGEYEDTSYTWTFYIIQGEHSSATLRWFGSSNGYYSESVTFDFVGLGE